MIADQCSKKIFAYHLHFIRPHVDYNSILYDKPENQYLHQKKKKNDKFQ